jgi:hypothetical protein
MKPYARYNEAVWRELFPSRLRLKLKYSYSLKKIVLMILNFAIKAKHDLKKYPTVKNIFFKGKCKTCKNKVKDAGI